MDLSHSQNASFRFYRPKTSPTKREITWHENERGEIAYKILQGTTSLSFSKL